MERLVVNLMQLVGRRGEVRLQSVTVLIKLLQRLKFGHIHVKLFLTVFSQVRRIPLYPGQ